jgi:hypothetical protein
MHNLVSLTSLADVNTLKLKYAHPIYTIAHTKETNIMATIGSIKKNPTSTPVSCLKEQGSYRARQHSHYLS